MTMLGGRARQFVALAGLLACGSYEPVRTGNLAHPIAGALSNRLSAINGRPFAVRVSPSGVVAVTQQDLNTVTLTDTTNRSSKLVNVGADPGDVVFNNSGTTAYVSAFNQGTITIVDVASATAVATIAIAANAYRLALMPDESRLFVTSTNGHVYVVNLSTRQVSSVALSGALNGCALDPSNRYLYVTSTGGELWKIDVTTLSVTGIPGQGGVGQEVAVSPNGADLYLANESGWIDVFDASTLAPRTRIIVDGAPFGLAVTLDGEFLYVTSPRDGMVDIVDVAARAVVKRLRVDGTPRRVAFDSFGLTAFVANEGNYVDVIR
jgi:DNA-binding beta-propeller fold protein YncE